MWGGCGIVCCVHEVWVTGRVQGGCIDLDVQPTLYFLSLDDRPTALVFQNYHLQLDVELDSVVILTCAAVVFGTRTP